MEPLIGRTVSQIKNRYYQNLKGKDLDSIKYILDDEELSPKYQPSSTSSYRDETDICKSDQDPNNHKDSSCKRDLKAKEKEK